MAKFGQKTNDTFAMGRLSKQACKVSVGAGQSLCGVLIVEACQQGCCCCTYSGWLLDACMAERSCIWGHNLLIEATKCPARANATGCLRSWLEAFRPGHLG